MELLDSFEQLFTVVCEYCKQQVSEIAYTLWIKDIEPLRMDKNTVFIKVKNKFKKNIIEEKYIFLLKEGFSAVLGFDVEIDVACDENDENPYPSATNAENSGQGTYPNGEYEYTFDTFIVGSSNKFAHAASLAVAANPANAYNPLFIYGGSGLGKTHLLTAIRTEVAKNFPKKCIIFVKGEEFTNELIHCIHSVSTKQFHDKYRTADLLLMDDVQFIGGKESTQEEFFHTFNSLYQEGKQIILTSDRPPKEIKTLEERLRTRFEWGLLADIQPPDFETRIAIIKRKAELLGIDIPSEVAEYIANRLKNNIRQLEGTVKKLRAYKLLQGSPPSIMMAQIAVRDILNDSQPIPVTIDRIISEVARTYNVSPQDMRSSKRNAAISNSRQIAMYIVREITQISMSAIGEEFGGRDHSTIVYAIQQVEKNMKKDPYYKELVGDIIKNIRNN